MNDESWRSFLDFFVSHRGRIIGIVIGLVVSFLIISLGFWRAVFICLAMGLGYYLGNRRDKSEGWAEIFRHVLPPR